MGSYNERMSADTQQCPISGVQLYAITVLLKAKAKLLTDATWRYCDDAWSHAAGTESTVPLVPKNSLSLERNFSKQL